MTNNYREPKPDDAVLGGQIDTPKSAVVLGGIAGVKQRWASSSDTVRIAALSEALSYGKDGLKLIAKIVQTETGPVQAAAWDLLWDIATERGKKKLLKYIPVHSKFHNGYAVLRDYLEEGDWRAADDQTGRYPIFFMDWFEQSLREQVSASGQGYNDESQYTLEQLPYGDCPRYIQERDD